MHSLGTPASTSGLATPISVPPRWIQILPSSAFEESILAERDLCIFNRFASGLTKNLHCNHFSIDTIDLISTQSIVVAIVHQLLVLTIPNLEVKVGYGARYVESQPQCSAMPNILS